MVRNNRSQSGKSYSGLARGAYTFTVTLTKANGKTASAARHFTVGTAFAVTLAPAAEEGYTRFGTDATYSVHLTNAGVAADSYTVSSSSDWTPQVYDATCTTPVTTTATLQPDAGVDLCVQVSTPEAGMDGDSNDTTITATSTADSGVTATAKLTTIAVAFDTLLVDADTNAPVDSAPYYEDALSANNVEYGYWDLAAHPDLPLSLLTSHTTVVWFTGNHSSGPLAPYESELAAFLDGGGHLFMSGQGILDGSAGTTSFVHDYLHIDWNGSETQNDKPTNAVYGATGNPVTDGIGSVPLNHGVLNAAAEDEITPIAPATVALTDDAGAADALSVSAGTYKVVFLAFPFEAYGSVVQRADLISRTMNWLGA